MDMENLIADTVLVTARTGESITSANAVVTEYVCALCVCAWCGVV